MRAAWWWIDRWRTSSAYMALSLAEQGAYRNLIDELWLRDGVLPDNDRVLSMASGAGAEWPAVKEAVMRYFVKAPQGWRNLTHDKVAADSKAHRDGQAAKGRARASAATRVGGRFVAGGVSPAGHQPGVQPPSLDLDLTLEQDQEQAQKETQTCPQERTSGGPIPRVLPSFVTIWNEVMTGSPLPLVRSWTPARDRLLKARLAEEGDLTLWRSAMERLRDSPHHRGTNDRGWVADVEFFLRASQAPKWLDMARTGFRPAEPVLNGKAGPGQIMAWAAEMEAKRVGGGS